MRIFLHLLGIPFIFLMFSCRPTVAPPTLSNTFEIEGNHQKSVLEDGNKIVNFLKKGLTDSSEKEILSMLTSARTSEKHFNELIDLLATNKYKGRDLLQLIHLQWDADANIEEEYDRYNFYEVLVKDSKAINLTYENSKAIIEMRYRAEGFTEREQDYYNQNQIARLIENFGIENLSPGMIKLGKEYFAGPDLGNENSLRRNKKRFAKARQGLGAPTPK